MITGFEDYTADLTDEEKTLAGQFAKSLSRFQGAENAISNKEIREKYEARTGKKIADTKVRKIVNYIRISGLLPCLLASNAGYYVSQDREEVWTYMESLRQRAGAIMDVAFALEKQLNDL